MDDDELLDALLRPLTEGTLEPVIHLHDEAPQPFGLTLGGLLAIAALGAISMGALPGASVTLPPISVPTVVTQAPQVETLEDALQRLGYRILSDGEVYTSLPESEIVSPLGVHPSTGSEYGIVTLINDVAVEGGKPVYENRLIQLSHIGATIGLVGLPIMSVWAYVRGSFADLPAIAGYSILMSVLFFATRPKTKNSEPRAVSMTHE